MSESLIKTICLEFMHINPIGTGYGKLPAGYHREERKLLAEDKKSAHEFNRALYVTLLRDFSFGDALIRLPETIKALYPEEFDRIGRNARVRPDDYFSSGNDSFRKDLAILTHRLIPCGAEFFFPYGGIPRSLAVSSGATGLFRFIAATLSTRGLKPLLELHMHAEVTENFTPKGWLATYENIADVLEINPQFLGVQSFSWFLDPALASISPHLVYLRQVPEQCGAYIFYSSDDSLLSSGALHKSQKRRLLAESGEYQPKIYARIWPKEKLLQRRWRKL